MSHGEEGQKSDKKVKIKISENKNKIK